MSVLYGYFLSSSIQGFEINNLIIGIMRIKSVGIHYIYSGIRHHPLGFQKGRVRQADCLIIDCFGLLSSIYRYGEIAYIGGGFGVSIHNTLEAAVYGIPVVFGPNNKKFREAQGLKACQGGFEIQGKDDFNGLMDHFLSDYAYLDKSGKRAGNYVRDNAGALEKIMEVVPL